MMAVTTQMDTKLLQQYDELTLAESSYLRLGFQLGVLRGCRRSHEILRASRLDEWITWPCIRRDQLQLRVGDRILLSAGDSKIAR